MTSVICSECGQHAGELAWRCAGCGGSLDLRDLPRFNPDKIMAGDFSLWRYAAMLPIKKRFTLGEGMTPLTSAEVDGERFLVKQEHLNPTGSFKDRGTAMLVNHLAGAGVGEVMDNSSGNAGASLAAFAGVAGMSATVYVPAATAVESKKRLMRTLGAEVIESDDAQADVYAAAEKVTYASHAWSPYFLLGQMTAAWEVWEQMGGRVPNAVATPVGHGGLFLGFYRGFIALREAGLIDRVPRMIAVQSAGVDPIVRGWEASMERPPELSPEHSVADGILVDVPVRGKQILAALYDTDGFALRVDNSAIETAQKHMARKGFIIEATSAVVAAALPQIRAKLSKSATLLMALTGNGLKSLA